MFKYFLEYLLFLLVGILCKLLNEFLLIYKLFKLFFFLIYWYNVLGNGKYYDIIDLYYIEINVSVIYWKYVFFFKIIEIYIYICIDNDLYIILSCY